ncbi:MAG: hypothetical protein KIS62_03595 [Ramlibacter sp.]|nr:hypothetical protein [Ramlibacter sp.]
MMIQEMHKVAISRQAFKFGLLVFSVFAGISASYAQPSQQPLLSRDGGGVKPNIMLTLDDSGSMAFQHMPEETIYVGSYSVDSPVGSNSVTMDPSDGTYLSSFFVGTVAAIGSSTNYRQKLMRSADTNSIYYNPEVRYLPWARADGTRMPAYSFAAAPFDPMSTGSKANLSNVRNVNDTWCFGTNSTSGCRNRNINYNPGLYYRLDKDASGNYKNPTGQSNYTMFDLNSSVSSYTRYPDRLDCGASSCTQAQERQNFSNWFTYYRSRILLAKGAIAEAFLGSSNTYRVGYGRINKTSSTSVDGVSTRTIESGVRDFDNTQRSALYDWLFDLNANGGTPLRRAMQDVGEYYSRSDNRGPWGDNPGSSSSGDHKTCRRSYHIMVTDGYWSDTVGSGGLSSAGNQDNTDGSTITGPGRSYKYSRTRPYRDDSSDTLADYAMKYWKADLRSGNDGLDNKVVPSAENPAFWQHMVNFMVGLGVRGTLNPDTDLPALTAGTKAWGDDKIDDLWHAALNSRGAFFSAKDPNEMAAAIRTSVGQAVERELREAGVATAATVLEEGNRKYVPYYRTGSWRGDVNAQVLDSEGQAGATVWNAEARLPVWDQRRIYTWDRPGGTGTSGPVTFTWANISAANRLAMGAAGSVPATTTASFVNFIRGDASNEGLEAADLFRKRAGRLGDIINSTPVFVQGSFDGGYASLPSIGGSYSSFIAAKRSRTGTLFIGANDGMLHAFKDSKSGASDDGREVFAYIPRAVYPSLSLLASKTYGTDLNYHQFFVDGPLREADAYVPAPASATASWRNYVVGSTGVGARAVFALDVTDSPNLNASAIRWEISDMDDTDMGNVTSPVEVGVLPNGRWVAVFGNGSYSNSGKAVLFVVTLATGAIQKITVDATGSNALGGVAALRDSNNQLLALYAGDLKGKLWKFDYDASAPSGFKVGNANAALFSATNAALSVPQPITQPPVLYKHSLGGGPLVVFGSGVLLSTNDANSTATQSMYGYWDKDSSATPHAIENRSTLVTRTISSFDGSNGASFYDISGPSIDWNVKRGWVIDMSIITGLRVVYPPQAVSSKLVLFSTVSPAQNVVVCESASGQGVNFIFPVETGTTAPYPLFDTNGDGVFNGSDTVAAGYGTGADGIDAVVRGGTQCTGGVCYTKYSIQNTTGQLMIQGQDGDPNVGGARTIRDRSWRRIINPPIK